MGLQQGKWYFIEIKKELLRLTIAGGGLAIMEYSDNFLSGGFGEGGDKMAGLCILVNMKRPEIHCT